MIEVGRENLLVCVRVCWCVVGVCRRGGFLNPLRGFEDGGHLFPVFPVWRLQGAGECGVKVIVWRVERGGRVGVFVEGVFRAFPDLGSPKIYETHYAGQLVLHLHGGWELVRSVVSIARFCCDFTDLGEDEFIGAFLPGGGGLGGGRWGGLGGGDVCFLFGLSSFGALCLRLSPDRAGSGTRTMCLVTVDACVYCIRVVVWVFVTKRTSDSYGGAHFRMAKLAAREAAGRVRTKHTAFVRGVLSAVPAQKGVVPISLAGRAKFVDVGGEVLQ